MIKKLSDLKKEQLLIGVLGMVLLFVIFIPVKNEDESAADEQLIYQQKEEPAMEEQLKDILQKISGVGVVDVFITYEDEGRMIVEKDESISEELIQEEDSNGGTRITTTKRNEKGTVYDASKAPYVIQKMEPTIQGVLVVAQGAGNLSVKKQIQETIEALFGLDTHKISIMKMEVSK